MNLPTFALRRGALLSLTLLLGILLAACGGGGTDDNGDSGDSGGDTVSVTDGVVEVSADDMAFDADVIEAPADEAFTIRLTNNESMPHNISVYTEEGGEEIVLGDVIGEGETTEVEVPALAAGTYFFVCDVHRDEMTGTLVVEG